MQPFGPSIHIFNPDTDYALAAGRKIYSPPAKIVAIRKSMALFPATFAAPEDMILLLDNLSPDQIKSSPYFHVASEKNLKIVWLQDIADMVSVSKSEISIRPWGWNHTLFRTLCRAGVPEELLKSQQKIDSIRALSHRRTAIPFRKSLEMSLPDIEIDHAVELFTVEDAIDFGEEHPGAYFKAPWSSSGRGVVNSFELTGQGLKEWMSGCIRRQGSILGEIGRVRAGDFASEWWCAKGDARFLGLSVFKTSGRGRYLGNIKASQQDLEKMISGFSPLWNSRIIEAQKVALDSIIAPYYDGPVGIDMFASCEGNINPCVEINLRQTMGHAALWSDTDFNL